MNIEKDVEEIKIKKILEKERALFNNTNGMNNNNNNIHANYNNHNLNHINKSDFNTPKSIDEEDLDHEEMLRLNIHHTETPFFGNKSMSNKRTNMNYTLTANNALNFSVANSPKNHKNISGLTPYDKSNKHTFSTRKNSINSGLG